MFKQIHYPKNDIDQWSRYNRYYDYLFFSIHKHLQFSNQANGKKNLLQEKSNY